MTIIKYTKRLYLETYTLNDKETFIKMHQEDCIQKKVSTELRTRKQLENLFTEVMEHQNEHGFSYWAIREQSTKLQIGQVGFLYKADGITLNLCYCISKMHCGKGYATEAVIGALSWIFNNTNKEKIFAMCLYNNYASLKILQKVRGKQITTYISDTNHIIIYYNISKRDFQIAEMTFNIMSENI